ncbi:hypothetical protein D3C76_1387010 [compost metagenome]
MIDLRRAPDEGPEQSHRIGLLQPGPGILPGRIQLGAIADDARVLHAFLDLLVAHPRQSFGIETEQHFAVALALLQHGDPRQPGLESFQQQQFEQRLRVALWHAPFGVVVVDVQRIVIAPEAAWHKAFRMVGRGSGESRTWGILRRFIQMPKHR